MLIVKRADAQPFQFMGCTKMYYTFSGGGEKISSEALSCL